jgi:hypothetical protein
MFHLQRRRRSAVLLGVAGAVVVLLAVVLVVVLLPSGGGGGRPAPPGPPGPEALPGPGTVRMVVPTPPAPSCEGTGRTAVTPLQTGTVSSSWLLPAPSADTTYDLAGVTSTAYPAGKQSVFTLGLTTPAPRTCVVGGTVRGNADDNGTWNLYHDTYNGACVKIISLDWMQVQGVRCDRVEDGMRPERPADLSNSTRFWISGTYLTHVRDDCIENDFIVPGVLSDNLWEQCNTGVSERPSGRTVTRPDSDTLILDHMLIGLWQTPHVAKDGSTVTGENSLFKWSASGHRVVIKCSMFMVDAQSLNGTDSMQLPPNTVLDDSACPDDPSTIVWLGPGRYPVNAGDLRVVTDRSVWDDAVAAWKVRHGIPAAVG